MKLNHDNVRCLLLSLEENLPLNSCIELNMSNSDEDTLYSALKLLEADYINGKQVKFMGGDFLILINSITWTGHEFLDNIRPETSWEKSKRTASKIGGASIKILSEIASKITAELINTQLWNQLDF